MSASVFFLLKLGFEGSFCCLEEGGLVWGGSGDGDGGGGEGVGLGLLGKDFYSCLV